MSHPNAFSVIRSFQNMTEDQKDMVRLQVGRGYVLLELQEGFLVQENRWSRDRSVIILEIKHILSGNTRVFKIRNTAGVHRLRKLGELGVLEHQSQDADDVPVSHEAPAS